jgi:amino acid transporter
MHNIRISFRVNKCDEVIDCICFVVISLQNILSLVMLSTSDIYLLITYSSIVESVFIMLSVSGILWLRWKRPDMIRPIKVYNVKKTSSNYHEDAVIKESR